MSDPKKRTPGELLDAIHEMHMDDELERIATLSDAEVAAEVRAEGGDPEAIGRRGATFIEREMARVEARARFQKEAAERLTRALEAADKAPKTPALPRTELLAQIDRAMLRHSARSSSLGGPIAIAFKKRKREEASDEELRSLLDGIAALEAIADAEGLEGSKTAKKTR